jgi:hypothetical protein
MSAFMMIPPSASFRCSLGAAAGAFIGGRADGALRLTRKPSAGRSPSRPDRATAAIGYSSSAIRWELLGAVPVHRSGCSAGRRSSTSASSRLRLLACTRRRILAIGAVTGAPALARFERRDVLRRDARCGKAAARVGAIPDEADLGSRQSAATRRYSSMPGETSVALASPAAIFDVRRT